MSGKRSVDKNVLDDLEVFTIYQAASILNCHPDTLRGAIRVQKLNAAKVGRDWRISKKDLAEYWEAQGGRSLFHEEPEGNVVRIPISEEDRDKLDDLARRKNTTVSNLFAEYLSRLLAEGEEAKGREEQDREELKKITAERQMNAKVKL